MKHIAKIGILSLAMVMGGAPLMACMLPSYVMTAQEKACCRRMAHRCGDHTMPSSHSCCKTVGVDQVAVAKSCFNPTPQLDFVFAEQPTAITELARRVVVDASVPGHSPPESPPSSSNILRV